MKLLTSPAADADIDGILAWSSLRFGASARRRYRALIGQALADIAADPRRAGVRDCGEFLVGMRSYHLRHSRSRSREGAVRTPRHAIFFRLLDPGTVQIVRVLHDSMDAAQHFAMGQRD